MSGTLVPTQSVGANAFALPVAPAASEPADRPQPPTQTQALPSPNSAPNSTPKIPRLHKLLATVCVLGFVAMAAQLGVSSLFADRIMPGVMAAQVPLGGLTRSQAEAKLQQHLAGYRVNLKLENNQSFSFTPDQVGIDYNVVNTTNQAYKIGRNHPLTHLSGRAFGWVQQVAFSFTANTKIEQATANRVAEAIGTAPTDASIVVQNGVPVVQPDKPGRGLSAGMVARAIDHAIAAASATPQALQATTLQARITKIDAERAIAPTQQLLATPISITYQGKHFAPTAAQVGQWIIFDKSPPAAAPGLIPKVDPAAVTSYVAAIAPSINVKPVIQKVNVENGVSTQFQAGQNGVSLDSDALTTAIVAAVSDKKPLAIEAPTTVVPFTTQYNNSAPLPFDKYVEVNLSEQHLWVYQDHKVIYDSPVTSGAAGAGFPTVTGQFAVYAKQTNRHLVGYQYGPRYNYDVFVQYWMPFYQGFGLHDASWRSSFGGPDYYYDGSHGCINLPLATAAFLYGWVDVGTPVWVHN